MRRRKRRRQERHQARLAAREKIMGLANELYNNGDSANELRAKIISNLEANEPSAKMNFWLKVLELLMPLIIRLMSR